jgi:hypothetical protein
LQSDYEIDVDSTETEAYIPEADDDFAEEDTGVEDRSLQDKAPDKNLELGPLDSLEAAETPSVPCLFDCGAHYQTYASAMRHRFQMQKGK